ncbi:WD repeat-containing protein 63 [Trachymyrmex septentrionalis]|uniref:WD repeat-containing protein 63 n=1 Tax=Trachymyrmex septentrionalis TaxID=34720 RepID=A0A195F9P6_9HYME|nr:WD repeat-containing protein 63 [Trachymyrmex septentrionalis]
MEEEEYEANVERMTKDIKFQADTEHEYGYDDFFEQSLDLEEEKSFEERKWEEEKTSPVQDWEEEAEKEIPIEMDDQTTEPKKIRYSISMEIPGLSRIDLSPLTQKIVGCIIGEDVTTEFPWVRVKKDIIEDNIDLHSESSDFLLVKDEVHAFPDDKIMIGYAPSLIETGQFYIVLTKEGRDAVEEHILQQRKEHENRVKNAIYKSPGRWRDLGSGADVDANFVKNTRPLFEIEVTSTADLLNVPINLTDRKADDQRDGYIELLPNNRQIFENVRRKLVSTYAQVSPIVRHNEAQTAPSISVNSWYQYLYEYETVDLSTYTEDKIDYLKYFLKLYTDEMCDQLLMNSMWDIYANDYANLVRSEKDTQIPLPIGYEEHQSYYDGKLIVDKVINDLCWHPFWTGTVIATYTHHAKGEHLIGPKTYDEVFLACEGNNKVLIWSFDDCLSPKLILECPREVTSVSVCPIDSNIIIGGCINGQIAIWHIPGKIEQVETVVTQTSAQVKYSIAMKSLMTWMRETTSLISPTAMSALKYSQKAGIIQIIWVPSHHKVDKNGRILSLPEDAPLDDLSYQFITASQDGTVAFWDLTWRSMEKEIQQVTGRKKKQKAQSAIQKSIAQSASPFKILDRVFKPHYNLVIQYPDENRQVVITTLSMYNPKFHKEQVEPFSMTRDDLTIRKYYRPIIEKADYVMEPKILIGTVEGEFGCVTWTGYEFTTDAGMDRETARWVWMKKIHDGPVTHVVRSNYYHRVVATIGGKIFAVWRDDFAEPLIWKKSNVGYSACSWGILRPTVLILGRSDGTIEIWDLEVKSHEPSFMQSLSGRIITGIYTHELPVEPQCIGFCDFNGSLRMFMAPRVLLTYDVGDIEWMKKFIDRQVQRINEFRDWQESWSESTLEDIVMKKKIKKMKEEKKHLEVEEKIKADTIDVAARAITPTKPARRKPWQFIEEAKERWLSMEVKRMQRVILEKKGLRKDVLERQRAPLLRLRQEARTKKRKIREILTLQDKIFEETIMFLFPEQQERRETLLPPLPVSAADRRLTIDEGVRTILDANYFFCKKGVFADPEEEIIYNFLEEQAEALAKLESTPFERTFDWRKVLAQGKSRRRSMDIGLKKLNRLKKTCKVDDAVNDASRLVDNV